MKRIHVTYQLRGANNEDHDKVERVLGFHAGKCPIARSVRDSIDITTEVEYVS